MLILIGGLVVAYFVYILIAKQNDKPSTDPAAAHAALREIVERAVEQARKLPELDASVEDAAHHGEGRAIANHSYEDLLATAILNKVIDKFQKERVDSNSNVVHDTDPTQEAKYAIIESEHNHEQNVGNYASPRTACGDVCNEIKRTAGHCEPTSFTMEERIEEVTTITSDDDELPDDNNLEFQCARRVPFPEFGMDIIDMTAEEDPRKPSSSSSSSPYDSSDSNCNQYSSAKKKRHAAGRRMDLVSPIESWKDNWLFQKKTTSWSQSDAVAMLVPSSNTYYKALIGDRNAEDTSDLSECSSTRSDEELDKDLMEAINDAVPCILEYEAQQAGKDEADVQNQIKALQEIEAELKPETQAAVTSNGSNGQDNNKEHLDVSEAVVDKDEEEERIESSSAFITLRERLNRYKREINDRVQCSGQRTIAGVTEDCVGKDMKMRLKRDGETKSVPPDEGEEQRDSEYTEHYDTAIQRHLDSLTKIEACAGESEASNETENITNEQLRKVDDSGKKRNLQPEERKSDHSKDEMQLSDAVINNKHNIVVTPQDERLSAPPRPGTIAEREHKKWENAPPIENNPYSEENIRRRCLERQYSKNFDIPGTHYELPNISEANLETLLATNRPDIKRFGRDYYINQSKAPSGERHERSRSAMSSASSRPSSSLSQRSSSIGDEQSEQQVSQHELEQFEGASLRGSLPRQRCCDPHASPHFAINPLRHMEEPAGPFAVDCASDWLQRHRHHEGPVERLLEASGRLTNPEKNGADTIEGQIRSSDHLVESKVEETLREKHALTENSESDTDFGKSSIEHWEQIQRRSRDDSSTDEAKELLVPQCEDNRLEDLLDDRDGRDSGMCSIGSRSSDGSERDRWRELYHLEDKNNYSGNEQMSTIGGKKFWSSGEYKHYIFGGIRPRSREAEDVDDEDAEDDPISPEDYFVDHTPEYTKFRYQTFGGIKKSKRINDERISRYRRILLRPYPSEAESAVPKS